MNKRLAILAAAATVAIGATSYAQDNTNTAAQQQQTQQQQQQQIGTENPAGTNTARGQVAPDKKEIAGVLGQISAAAVKGQYSDVAERFTKEDRDRLKDLKDDKSAANWDTFKKNWKDKYGKDFDDDKAQAAFNGGTAAIQILSGDLEARTAGERIQPGQGESGQTGSTSGDNTNTTPSNRNDTTSGTGATGNANSNGVSGSASVGGVGVSGSAGGGGANANVDTTRDRNNTGGSADANATGNAKGDSKDAGSGIAASDQSRRVNKNMATVIIPESHGMPQATLHFINEGTLTDAWRLDVPDSMDAAALQSKLNEHVGMINQQKDQWPSDVNEAYAMVGHHVALAFQDANAMQGEHMGRHQRNQNQTGGRSNSDNTGATGQ